MVDINELFLKLKEQVEYRDKLHNVLKTVAVAWGVPLEVLYKLPDLVHLLDSIDIDEPIDKEWIMSALMIDPTIEGVVSIADEFEEELEELDGVSYDMETPSDLSEIQAKVEEFQESGIEVQVGHVADHIIEFLKNIK